MRYFDARVIENRSLGGGYFVLRLGGCESLANTIPGQFVMVKPGHDLNPLLRRPFSVFEVLRNPVGKPTGISLLSKRIGVTTRALYDVEPGACVQCLGPLGRPFTLPDRQTAVWMVASTSAHR